MNLTDSYAIVAYVAGPIADWVDRLRKDSEPGCPHHAHITILPPRPLVRAAPSAAIEFARPLVSQFEPFQVRFGSVEAFYDSRVIYLSISAGACELLTMHDVLNTGLLEQTEVFDYVPHLTLCQQLPQEPWDRLLEPYLRRWQELDASPPIRIDAVTFVQQRADGRWIDLAELGLGRVPAVG
ncbi:MAG: 2'-5' RNA ligase family protein [Acidobacteria bacterium]|nr:2'-5' RNA ligase family protein [Acidobacteriota bacterium]